VEPAGQLVQPLGAVRAVQPGADVGLAGLQAHLAGQEQLAPAERGVPVEGALGDGSRVAGERGVYAPHLPATVREPRCSGAEDVGGVVAGAARAVLAYAKAVGESSSLRRPFAQVVAGEVEQLGGLLGRRQQQDQVLEPISAGAGAGEPGAGAQHSAAVQLDLQFQGEARGVVVRGDDDGLRRIPAAALLFAAYAGLSERAGPRAAVAVTGQAREAEPAGGLLRQQ
jgi:hypothetical protein